ncbi:hypothetical protein GALMADRAFT_359340 [Galerina marginata CBS 339.88]|uniref:Uncharacterized protein n=1 Tax=Galerina marginata (strain CBS 339.88) TaxID=685588 RepID=A0A067TQD9_GALM3|nr:hypothetical protein GALMADRAFT_359340 [Galerina marginata CBS 339.88]
MSFQHFRLGELPLLQQQSSSQPQPVVSPVSSTKQPYGSGDTDDGYTLVFANLDAFQEWRAAEEERHCVEFVKGDTHGSKADPPRFKDHTKLVCARHSRSGRKKYVKKHPERVRKVPSRKLDGQGCQASVSYKTYFDTEEVRAYISQHSHEIGMANLPFTRRGRKAAVQHEKDRGRTKSVAAPEQTQPIASSSNTVAMGNQQPSGNGVSSFSSAVSMLAPLPGQSFPTPTAQPYGYAPPVPTFAPVHNQPNLPHERWENMATLFQTVRENARAYEFPAASVAALETVLIRLYLEGPIGIAPAQTMGNLIQNGLALARNQPPPPVPMQTTTNGHQPMNGNINDANNTSNAEDAS